MGIVFCCFDLADNSGENARESAYKIDTIADGEEKQEQPKVYSWDKKKLDPKQFMFDGVLEETVMKTSGQINGQQFIVQNCKDSHLYLFDYCASVTVDDCTNCTIFIGPCKGSIFIRDCSNCTIAVSCQQFRTRDCSDLRVFLHCSTQPIIEASKSVSFACFQVNYDNFANHLNDASLSPFNNQWSNVHDFTPEPNNFTVMDEDILLSEFMKIGDFPSLICNVENSFIPQSLGTRKRHGETSFCICFCADSDMKTQRDRCLILVKQLSQQTDCRLVSSKEVTVSKDDLHKIIDNKAYDDVVVKGPIIGIELCGTNSLHEVRDMLEKRGWKSCIYVPQNVDSVAKKMNKFKSFADTLMGV